MKIKMATLMFFIALISILGFKQNDVSENNPASTSINNYAKLQPAPNFTLKDTDGKLIKLSDFKGKPIIVDFWATWCAPCRKGIPDLIKLKKKFKDKIVIIGISVDGNTKKDVVPFKRNFGINYHIVYATDKVIQDYGGIRGIPTSFVINKKGEIVKSFVGLQEMRTYQDLIESLL